MHCDLDLWPIDPKVNRPNPWLKKSVPMKFHEDRCKGEAVMCMKPFYLTMCLQTDGQTDGQGDSSTPPQLRCGGYKNLRAKCFLGYVLIFQQYEQRHEPLGIVLWGTGEDRVWLVFLAHLLDVPVGLHLCLSHNWDVLGITVHCVVSHAGCC